jgi:DNA-binding LacI/PurR family transcriptional regulator
MKPTIRSIARKAEVSVATVSRVLNDSPLVKEETKRKIERIISEAGYKPDTIARSLTRRKTDTIGVIVPTISNPFFGELIEGIEEESRANGHNIIISNSAYNTDRVKEDIEILLARKVDGLIMSSADVDCASLDYLNKNNVPFVLTGPVNYRHQVNYVSVDNYRGAMIATEHLLRLGHRRIGYIPGPYDNYINELRFKGFKSALEEYQLSFHSDCYFYGGTEENVQKLLRLGGRRPSALVAFNDYIAIDYLEKLETSGLKVPDNMSLVGFDNIKFASYYSINLTTVENGQYRFGKEAFRLLLELVTEPSSKHRHLLTEPELVVRGSCGSLQREAS